MGRRGGEERLEKKESLESLQLVQLKNMSFLFVHSHGCLFSAGDKASAFEKADIYFNGYNVQLGHDRKQKNLIDVQ